MCQDISHTCQDQDQTCQDNQHCPAERLVVEADATPEGGKQSSATEWGSSSDWDSAGQWDNKQWRSAGGWDESADQERSAGQWDQSAGQDGTATKDPWDSWKANRGADGAATSATQPDPATQPPPTPVVQSNKRLFQGSLRFPTVFLIGVTPRKEAGANR